MTLHEILDRLLPCKHKWKTIEIIKIYTINDFGEQIGDLPTSHLYILECEICGSVKKLKV